MQAGLQREESSGKIPFSVLEGRNLSNDSFNMFKPNMSIGQNKKVNIVIE